MELWFGEPLHKDFIAITKPPTGLSKRECSLSYLALPHWSSGVCIGRSWIIQCVRCSRKEPFLSWFNMSYLMI